MHVQEVFYWMGIIFMSVMFLLMIASVVAVLAIKRKVHELQRSIEEKLAMFSSAFEVGESIVEKAKSVFGRK